MLFSRYYDIRKEGGESNKGFPDQIRTLILILTWIRINNL